MMLKTMMETRHSTMRRREENNQEVVRQLLDAGADKNARNKDEKTAYEVADDSNKGILGDVDNKGTQSGSLG